MFINRILLLTLAIALQASAFGFTIMNLTDSEKVVQVQEAYRPHGNNSSPVPLSHTPFKIAVPPHAQRTLRLREPCTALLVGIVTTNKKKGKIKKETTVNTTTTCYEPYSYEGFYETHITDNWGIVVHKPIANPNLGSPFDPDYSYKSYLHRQNLERGYGIKCLHPQLLAKVSSLKELPEELLK